MSKLTGRKEPDEKHRLKLYSNVNKFRIPKDVMEYFRKTGAAGGNSRAKNHSKKQLSEWGKLGGRPKGSGTKKAPPKKKKEKK